MMEKMLDGQVAIVTGGSGGIGRAICRRLAGHGARVIVHYRAAADAALELVVALEGEGLQARAVGADLSTAKGCETLMAASGEAFGTATILVNNAAMQPVAAFERISPADLASMLATNVQGPFRLMQLFAAAVIEAGIQGASIVNIARELASNPSLRRILADPYSLVPDGKASVRQPSIGIPQRDPETGAWLGPFVMAAVNTRIVPRSNALSDSNAAIVTHLRS